MTQDLINIIGELPILETLYIYFIIIIIVILQFHL